MAQIVLNPSAYVSYGATAGSASISNQTNPVGMGSSSTAYATLTTSTSSNSTSYAFWKFDCSSIPSNVTIDSVSCVAKCYVSSTSRISTRSIQLYNGTSTAKGSSTSFTNSTASTITLSCGTWTRSELDDINIRVAGTRGTSTQTASIRFYGADLTVNYTLNTVQYTVTINSTGNGTTSPTGAQQVDEGGSITISAIPDTGYAVRMLDNSMTVTNLMVGNTYTISNVQEAHTIDITYLDATTYQVNTNITNGTLLSPGASYSAIEGDDVTIQFKGNDGTQLKSITVNGIAVTPTESQVAGNASYEISTNYSTYSGSLSDFDDGSNTTYWWSSEAQATGKYVLWTFDGTITLNSFSCYSSNSGDYPNTNNYLQVSTDGDTWEDVGAFSASQTNNFTSINKTCKYVRIYAKTSITNWLVLANVQLNYTSQPTTGYSYTISNITANTNVIILFKEASDDYSLLFKDTDGAWKEGTKIYQKRGNCWWEISKSELLERLENHRFRRGTINKHTNDPYLDGRVLLFEDDFDEGVLNEDVWTPETGFCRNQGCVAYYTADALSFEDSNLVITGKRTSGLPNASNSSSSWALTHTSGSIHSQDKWIFQYGRAQAKLKCPKVSGSWPAWWLFGNERKFQEYHTDGSILTETGVEWSECGEVDIIEQYGSANAYEWNLWQSQSGASSSYKNGQYSLDPSEWHIYEVEWTPTTMNFMVDGVSVSGDIDITVSQGLAYRTYEFFMILNLQLGGTAGTVSADEMKMYIDWVRIYDMIKQITITYNVSDKVKFGEDKDDITDSTIPTSESIEQGKTISHEFFPIIGYKFDTLSFEMKGTDITNNVYHPETKSFTIYSAEDDVTISATTVIDTEGHEYRPLGGCPTGFKELTIDENSDITFNSYALNPGYNIADSSVTVNMEFVMPTDFVFSDTDENVLVPEEMDFASGLASASSGDNYHGVINDATLIGNYPMWNITNWNDNNYFVITLPIAVVGTTVDDAKAWLAKNNIIFYYKHDGTSTSEEETSGQDELIS